MTPGSATFSLQSSRAQALEAERVGCTPEVPEVRSAAGKAGRGFKLREASFEDHAQIASLESRYGLMSKNYDEWSHLWLGNPVYRDLQPGWSIGWVLEDQQRQVVATMGNIPLLYELGGRRILAASGRHWAAEPEYRSASLILLERVVNQKNVDLYLNNTVAVRSVPAVNALGCLRVPVGVWDESGFWITSYHGFSERFLAWKNVPLHKPLSYGLAAAAYFKDRFAKSGLRESDVEVTACSSFDERFDGFWENLKRNNPQLLLAVRTREMLQWHYKHALLDDRLWILTVVDGSRLVAYATFERKDKPELGLKRILLVDYQSLDGSTAFLSPLLFRALRKCRDEGIHVLESIGRWLEEGEVIDTVAPYRRKLSAWSYVYRANDPTLSDRLTDRRVWAPSLFDGDASLCAGVVMRAR
jgi:hypothetical protein